jgi:hypothetical protein
LLIDIKTPSRQVIKRMETRFALQRDGWDDYGFKTLYHLHFRHGDKDSDVTYIGGVKILKKGQQQSISQFLQEPFDKLSEEWVSVGTSLDYYQRLNELPDDWRETIMDALNDAVAHPDLVVQFENEAGWRTSVFRDNQDWHAFLADAGALYEGNFSAFADVGKPFFYTPAGSNEPIEFDFNSPEPSYFIGPYRQLGPRQRSTLLPDRIIVLVGRNGSGKSTLLARLAHVAFASPQERATEVLRALGTLSPPSIGFMRIITISYSAFDSFVVPGLDAKDLSQTTQGLADGEGRFVFCGLRDLVAEARADLAMDDDENLKDSEAPHFERRTSTRLKPVEQLADEFAKLVLRIR